MKNLRLTVFRFIMGAALIGLSIPAQGNSQVKSITTVLRRARIPFLQKDEIILSLPHQGFIAETKLGDGSVALYTVDSAGNSQKIYEGEHGAYYSLSAKDERICFVRDREMVVRDIESGQEHRIPQIAGDVARLFPGISPSGKHIVYNAHVLKQPNETLNDFEVVVAGIDDNSAHVVGHGGWPRWSPDGNNILFTMLDETGPKSDWPTYIWIVNPDGSGLRRLNSSKGMQGWPVVWSPDGRYIMDDAGNELHIVDVYADTCWVLPIDKLTRPTDKYRAEIADWAWFPDGKSVLFETVLISGPDDEMEGMQWYKIEMQDKSIAKVDLPIEAHEGDPIIWLNNSTVLFQDKAGSWNEAHIRGEGK